MDYAKWDELAKQQELEDERERIDQSIRNRQAYIKEQTERQQNYLKKQQSHNHTGEHDHSHDHHQHDDSCSSSGCSVASLRPRCGCGYADPDELKRIALEQQRNPPEPEDVKNRKKLLAAKAAKEDANRLFQQGNFEDAFKLYERGVLILTGMIGPTDEQYAEARDLECTLDLNACACKLKLKQPLEALTQAQMALDIDQKRWKAWSRCGDAHQQLGHWDDAKRCYHQALLLLESSDDKSRQAATAELQRALAQVDAGMLRDAQSDREFQRQFSRRIAEGLRLESS